MRRILLATDAPFWLKNNGTTTRIASLCAFLKKEGFELVVVYTEPADLDCRPRLERYCPDKIYYIADSRQDPASYVRILKRLLPWNLQDLLYRIKVSIMLLKRKKEPSLKDFYSKTKKDRMRDICLKHRPDFIIIEYIKLAYLIDDIKSVIGNNVRLIIDTHDINYIRTEIFHEAGEINYINISKDDEIRELSKFDLVCAIQKNEEDILKKILPDKECITVGHSHEITKNAESTKGVINISFVGSRAVHNKNGLIHFINNIWGKVYPEYKNKIQLKIFGSICGEIKKFGSVKGVDLRYYVNDLSEIYKASDILINPMYIGSGLKIKSVEALCYSKPLITTPMGADGFQYGMNTAFYVCDNDEEFIRKLKELISSREKREELSGAAYEFARKNFSEELVYKGLYDYLNKV